MSSELLDEQEICYYCSASAEEDHTEGCPNYWPTRCRNLLNRIEELEAAHKEIIDMNIPVGVGSECADWFKDIARQALDSEEGR